jgi:hypothetical protein
MFPYIHTTHALSSRHLRRSSETSTFYQSYLAMMNTADVIGGNAGGVSAVNP